MADSGHEKLGYLICIVNCGKEQTRVTFTPRPGAETDSQVYKELFVNRAGFSYLEFKDLYSKKLWACSQDGRTRCGCDTPEKSLCVSCTIKSLGSDFRYLVLAISSHGYQKKGETIVQFVGGETVPMSEFYKALDTEELKEVIKILFIQCCRVENKQGEHLQEYLLEISCTCLFL